MPPRNARERARSCAAGGRSRRSPPRRRWSWPMNVTRPSARTPRVAGLPMSWKQRGEAQRLPARELVGRAARRAPRAPRGAVVAEHALEVALEPDQPPQHLERVAVDVEVVEVALLHPVQRGQLGQHRRRRPSRSASSSPSSTRSAQRPAAAARRRCAPATASGTRRAAARSARSVSGSGASAELGGQPHQPQRPQRVALVRVSPQHPQRRARSRSRDAAVRVDQLAARERHRHRVDREVALREVVLDRGALQRRHVAPPSRARGRSRARRRTRPTAGTRGPPQRLRPSPRAAGSGVARRRPGPRRATRPPEQRVAHGAAHDPGVALLARARRAPRRTGAATSSRSSRPLTCAGVPAAPAACSPQVTS